MSRCAGVSASIARSRWSATTWPAPPSPVSVAARRRRRALRALDVPQSLHHELQVRRLDPRRAAVAASRAPRPPGPSSMRPAPTPSSTAATSSSSIVDGIPLELAPALERLDDRRATGRAIEVIEAEDVPEQVRDRALQPVERGERVLPQREQHVDAQRPVDEGRERRVEAVALAVVREVLLRLVEDQVDVAVDLRDASRRRRARPARRLRLERSPARAPARAPRSSSRRRRRAAARAARAARARRSRAGATTSRRRSARRAR